MGTRGTFWKWIEAGRQMFHFFSVLFLWLHMPSLHSHFSLRPPAFDFMILKVTRENEWAGERLRDKQSCFSRANIYCDFIAHTFSGCASPYRSAKEENIHSLARCHRLAGALIPPCSPSCWCGELWGQPLGGAFFFFSGCSCWNKWKSIFFFVLCFKWFHTLEFYEAFFQMVMLIYELGTLGAKMWTRDSGGCLQRFGDYSTPPPSPLLHHHIWPTPGLKFDFNSSWILHRNGVISVTA